MESFTIQEAQGQLQQLIAQSSKDHRHFKITSNEGNAVLIPEETYNNLLITLEVLSAPGLIDCFNEVAMNDEESLELDVL